MFHPHKIHLGSLHTSAINVPTQFMKTTSSLPSVALLATLLVRAQTFAAPDPNWLDHDRTRPLPPVVKPGTASTPNKAGTAPSDAVVLFDGKDLSQWSDMDGKPTKW